jgi:hypothetical protein
MPLSIRPITLTAARAFAGQYLPRPAPHAWRYGLSLHDGDRVVAVIFVGRPAARALDDGRTLQVSALVTDGTTSVASPKLLAAALDISRRMGYGRMVAYLDDDEPADAFRAAGWTRSHRTRRRPWRRRGRPVQAHGDGPRPGRTCWLAPGSVPVMATAAAAGKEAPCTA